MSDETPGEATPTTPAAEPVEEPAAPAPATDTAAPGPEAVAPAPAAPDPVKARRGVLIPRWVAVVVGAVVLFVGGFGIANAVSGGHGHSDGRDRQSSAQETHDRGRDQHSADGAHNGVPSGSRQGGAAPHTRTTGS